MQKQDMRKNASHDHGIVKDAGSVAIARNGSRSKEDTNNMILDAPATGAWLVDIHPAHAVGGSTLARKHFEKIIQALFMVLGIAPVVNVSSMPETRETCLPMPSVYGFYSATAVNAQSALF